MIKILKKRTAVPKKHEMIVAYEEGLKKDLVSKANRLIKLIDDWIIQVASLKGEIFYLKMQGDFHRYISEAITESSDSLGDLKSGDENQNEKVLNEQL